jgi:hypothetical protein
MSGTEDQSDVPKRKRRWYQFSARTRLVLVTILVGLVTLLKLEADARKGFATKSATVESVVIRAWLEARPDVENVWMRESRANPSFSAFVDNHPKGFSVVSKVTTFDGSHRYDYFRQCSSWTIVLQTPPTNIDLTWLGMRPGDYSNDVDRVNVESAFSRPLADLFREPRIQIIKKAAANNELLVERLKAGFDQIGVSSEVVDQ